MTRWLHTVGFLAACVLASLLSQSVQAGESPFAHYQHTRWNLEDGAPSQISSLAQGSDGYLWIGAGLGVYRFDGKHFEKFQPLAGEKLREADVYVVFAASNGDIWAGYDDAGLARIRHGNVTRFGAADGMDKGTIAAIAEDRQGGIWATQLSDIVRFDGQQWMHFGEPQGFPAKTTYYTTFVDREGTVWVSTSAGLFSKAEGQDRFSLAMPDSLMVVEFKQSPDGVLWLARNDGTVTRVAVKRGVVAYAYPPLHFPATGLTFDQRGQVWIGSFTDGLRLVPAAGQGPGFNEETYRQAGHFSEADGLSSKFLWPGLEDRQGNIWFASKAGLDRFRWKDFVTVSRASEVGLVVAANGDVWGASQRMPLAHLQGDPAAHSGVPDHMTAVSRDANGTAWFAGDKGVWRMDGDKTSFVAPLPAGENLHWAAAILHDRSGTLWLSTPKVGLSRFIHGTWVPVPNASRFARSLMQDAAGHVWRSAKGEVLRTSNGEDWTSFGKAQGLDIEDVLVMRQLQDGFVVAGGREGAAVLRDGHFVTLTLADKRPLRGVGAILQSADGAVWLHTLDGVTRIPLTEWQTFLTTPGYAMHARHFDFADGLPGQLAVGSAPTGIEGADGKLWFATSNGVVRIDPLALTKAPGPPPLAVTSLVADDVAYPLNGVIELPAGTMQVRIGFTALDLAFPDRVRLRYRLANVDASWHDTADQRGASYTRLGPGQFRFELLASGAEGQWSPVPATLAFRIAPFFYQTVWFRFVCAGVLLLLVALFALWRMRAIAQKIRLRMDGRMAERVRIARELHDTVLQGFQALLLHMEAASRKLSKDDPALPGLSRSIEMAQHLLEEGRDRIVRMRAAPLSDASLADELYADVSQLAAARGAVVHVATEGDERPLSLLARDEARGIALEAVCNALIHGDATLIRVELAFQPQALVLRVADNGRGVDLIDGQPPTKPERWGLVGMHERARRLGASLSFASAPGEGFTATLAVPASCAYATWWRNWIDRSTGMNGRA